jgi:hypothetical protein
MSEEKQKPDEEIDSSETNGLDTLDALLRRAEKLQRENKREPESIPDNRGKERGQRDNYK